MCAAARFFLLLPRARPASFGAMPLVDSIWIEFQISSLKIVLFLLAWYSQEIGYSIIWYCLSFLEVLIFILQLLIYSGYAEYHVDSWGSPFGLPSLLVTQLIALLTYVFFYHLWWRNDSWKPTVSTVLYVCILLGLCGYWCLLVPTWWYQILISALLGIGYATLTSFIIKWLFVPFLIDLFISTFENTYFIHILGSKNTLLVNRHDKEK